LLFVATLFAQGPANVLVVVNNTSAASRAVGEYYVARRAIPAANVCRIQAPEAETVSRAVYDASVAAPIAACLKSRKLVERVLYIATTLGVPLRIEGSSGLEGDQASVDSELTLMYADLHSRPHRIEGALTNPLYGRRDEPFVHPRFPIYLVCRLAAYSVDEVKGMIDRSLAAVNRGRVVIDMQSDTDKEGDDWLLNAAIVLPKERVVLDQSGTVIYGQRDVIAYASWGSNDPHHKRRFPGFGWLAGAIVTEYVSTDGRTFARPPDSWQITNWQDRAHWFSGSPQSLSADYIHEGATGVSGHVYEPYLARTPRPDYVIPAYLGGRTLAESYYLGIQALSWRNIVLGDPLCRLK
jgi:uncharacterized protein (TIGR03790 family)